MLFVRKVGVVGAGVMGSQIAEIMALNRLTVVLKDISMEYVERGLKRIEESLKSYAEFQTTKADREIERFEKRTGVKLTEEQKRKARETLKPRFTDEDIPKVMERIKPTETYDDFKDVDIVIEAVVEDIDVKKEVFRELDQAAPRYAILGTNTSTLSITEIASATKRPEKVIGIHFFNPATALPLVEVIPGLLTSEETVTDVMDFISGLRNQRYQMIPRRVKETPGFLVNRILGAMLNEAYACLEEGIASMRDIDVAMKTGAGMPMGPFELSDLIGIDVIYHVVMSLHKQFGGNSPTRRIPQIIRHMYYSKRWGRKTGRGFYTYK